MASTEGQASEREGGRDGEGELTDGSIHTQYIMATGNIHITVVN